MALRFMLILVLVVLAVVEKSSAGAASDAGWGFVADARSSGGLCTGDGTGLVGECINEDDEFGLESESTRRSLAATGRDKFISYGALSKNRIPCGRRGRSYYNCFRQGRANPYNRGCTAITRCARDLH